MTDQDQLLDVLRATGPVLLDFDGPVTKLLQNGRNAELAKAARQPMIDNGIALPEPLLTTSDHMAVLRFAAEQSPAILHAVDQVTDRGEREAAEISEPTPGAIDALHAFRDSRRPVVIVSNNAEQAIRLFLRRHNLSRLIDVIIGRLPGRPELMKPNPHIVQLAIEVLQAEPSHCVLVGDQVSDIQVSRLTGVRSIGYAKNPKRGTELAEAGADAIITDIRTLADAVRRVPALSN